ncbi:MAG TPA: hypothetical protein VH352_23925 [Pseudonocardiaceae bacterium]|nr:hypothetical protein [Pseudonocardiaceae bacterium]
MTGRRKLLVTLHVLTAASNLGAVVVILVLAAFAHDASLTRLCVYTVDIPLLLVGLVIGVTSALMSPWGLFRHGWVVKKLLLTMVNVVVATGVVGPWIGTAGWVSSGGLVAQVALFVLPTVLSVYKPKGRLAPSRPGNMPGRFGIAGSRAGVAANDTLVGPADRN